MISEIDIKILKEFNKLKEGEETSTWRIMRNLFPQGRSNEEMRLKYRLRKMEKMGLFIITKNSPQHFCMIQDNVIFKKISFPDIKSEGIAIKVYGKWEIFEL